jgi:hypothetical protein
MPVDVKARITYDRDAKQEFSLDCKQLGIEGEASGSIETDIEDLRERVTKAISEEFHVAPSSITITNYVMSMTFSIEGPTNHTLDKFTKEAEEEESGST